MAALWIGAGPALAFEQSPEAPPLAAPDAKAPAVQLQDPAPGTAQSSETSGTKLFGFSLLPKLDFGLELLYSQQPMDLQQGGITTLDGNGDLTVLGKVKRSF
jgi:hypothetical protein